MTVEITGQQWRKAARRAMRKAARKEARKRLGTTTPSFNYRWEHVKAVVAVAERLATLTGADQEIVVAAAWLHDIRKNAGEEHPRAGADYARNFLSETDFPPEKIEAVAVAIADHMGLWRDEPLTHLESMVLWDADKLTKIGITAALQWTGLRIAQGGPVTTRDLLGLAGALGWQERTVSSMHTAPARAAARRRVAAFQQLWETLAAELNGRDLEVDAGLDGAG